MCLILEEMDGGAMWEADIAPLHPDAQWVMRRLRSLDCIEEIDSGERGVLYMCTDEADRFLARYETGQMRFF